MTERERRQKIYNILKNKYPDPGVGKDREYRNPGSGGTDTSMLITDPNTGEVYRRGGARSVRQMQASTGGKRPMKKQSSRKAGALVATAKNQNKTSDQAQNKFYEQAKNYFSGKEFADFVGKSSGRAMDEEGAAYKALRMLPATAAVAAALGVGDIVLGGESAGNAGMDVLGMGIGGLGAYGTTRGKVGGTTAAGRTLQIAGAAAGKLGIDAIQGLGGME